MTSKPGRHHPTLRRIRALRRDADLRRRESVLVAEGIHLAREALDSGAAIEIAVVSPLLESVAEGPDLLREFARRGIPCSEVAPTVLDSLQDARSPQPVLMVVRRPDAGIERALGSAVGDPLVVVLAGIQDPGNLGGIVRTSEAAGATGCLVVDGCADPFHPRAVRATTGSIFRLPLCVDSTRRAVERLRERGLRRVGADAARGEPYDRATLTGPVALFLGGEGSGLPPDLLDSLDERVHVPMRPGVESLSVGAAAAVLLFEAARQRNGV